MLEKYRKKSLLQQAIDGIVKEMLPLEADSEEFAKMSEQLQKLHALKVSEKPKPMSYDTVILAASNLAGIIVIVKYEQTAVIVSKALNFMHKLR